MSTRNRERRRAKKLANDRARRTGRRPDHHGSRHHDNPFQGMSRAQAAGMIVNYGADAICRNDKARLAEFVDVLNERSGDPIWPREVSRALLTAAATAVRGAWARGWQPADLVRLAQRRMSNTHAELLVDVIAAEMRPYAANTVDERWAAQLDMLGATSWWSSDDTLADEWIVRMELDRRSVIQHVLELCHLLGCGAYNLPRLCPLPGDGRRGALHPDLAGRFDGDPRLLDRVRALLAKAESTEFTEEAEALTAKAQELMARHSIDYALLAVGKAGGEEPGGVRMYIDNPYETAKSLLLQKVAEANRCRAIWDKVPGFSTVVGFRSDLDATELLYTSLLVQASAAMTREGSRRDASGRSRTRSFRQSFLDAFAVRIGERLMAATEETSRQVSQETGSAGLLPVLAARNGQVDEAMEKMFPTMASSSVRMSNLEGWASGTAAADLAALHSREAVAATR